MEPEGSLPQPQGPITCPYPGRAATRPNSSITKYFLTDANIVTLAKHRL